MTIARSGVDVGLYWYGSCRSRGRGVLAWLTGTRVSDCHRGKPFIPVEPPLPSPRGKPWFNQVAMELRSKPSIRRRYKMLHSALLSLAMAGQSSSTAQHQPTPGHLFIWEDYPTELLRPRLSKRPRFHFDAILIGLRIAVVCATIGLFVPSASLEGETEILGPYV